VAALIERQEGRAGVRGLLAEDAVELDGVAARLVNLQRELGVADDEGGLGRGANLRRQDLRGLFRDARGVPEQVQAADVLVARGREVTPERIGIGTGLDVLLGDGGRDDAAPRLDYPLVDVGPLRRRERFLRTPKLEGPLGDFYPVAAAHLLRRPDQEVHPFLEGDGERVLADVVGPRAYYRLLGREDDVVGLETRARPGDGHRLRSYPSHLLFIEPGGRGEAPRAVHDYADAEALGLRGGDVLGLTVLRLQIFAPAAQDADVPVTGSFRLDQV